MGRVRLLNPTKKIPQKVMWALTKQFQKGSSDVSVGGNKLSFNKFTGVSGGRMVMRCTAFGLFYWLTVCHTLSYLEVGGLVECAAVSGI